MTLEYFQSTTLLKVETEPYRFHMITSQLDNWLEEVNASSGLLTILVKHTSASLTIQENADPSVRVDLVNILDEIAPQNKAYHHNNEGPDDMPAHIKSMLTDTVLSLPVVNGRMDLGTWQGVFLIEHRAQRNVRSLRLMFTGT